MYTPKPKSVLTINGEVIEVYDYLMDPIFVKLLNDVVLGINPEMDQINFLTIDEFGIYDDIASTDVEKPTFGSVKLNIGAKHLKVVNSYLKNRKIDYDSLHINPDLLQIQLQYFNHERK